MSRHPSPGAGSPDAGAHGGAGLGDEAHDATAHSDAALPKAESTRAQARKAAYQAFDALAAMAEAVTVVDEQARVVLLNPAAEELLGWSHAEAEGKPLGDVLRMVDQEIGGQDSDQFAPLDLTPCLRDGLRIALDERSGLVRRDRSIVAVDGSVTAIYGEDLLAPDDVSITGAVLLLQDVSDRRMMTRRLDRAARFDQLTGLLNRKGFEQHVTESLEAARARRQGDAEAPSAFERGDVLFYLDLDLFKVVNDTCGHAAGDMLMQWTASLIRERLGDDDVLARVGGDEFSLLLADSSLEAAERLSGELHAALRNFRFIWQDKSFTVGVSMGMVPVSADFDDVSELMGAADKACYLAKRKGRGRTEVYRQDSDDVRRHQGQMSWIVKIQRALDEDLFELHWQRILPLDPAGKGRRLFFEVLVRMRESDGSLSPPQEFLDVAERFGLTPTIDRWVVSRTLRNLARQPAELLADIECVSINLSGASLGDRDMQDFIAQELAATGVEPRLVCFEITETAAVSNLRRASDMIHSLRRLDCRWALDDFGSGMSSYNYLRELPVDFVKIDGKIVLEILDSPLSWTILQSINEIAHVIDARTIAEHVETPELLWELHKMGIDFAQGLHIGAPKKLRAAERLEDYPDVEIEAAPPVAIET